MQAGIRRRIKRPGGGLLHRCRSIVALELLANLVASQAKDLYLRTRGTINGLLIHPMISFQRRLGLLLGTRCHWRISVSKIRDNPSALSTSGIPSLNFFKLHSSTHPLIHSPGKAGEVCNSRMRCTRDWCHSRR